MLTSRVQGSLVEPSPLHADVRGTGMISTAPHLRRLVADTVADKVHRLRVQAQLPGDVERLTACGRNGLAVRPECARRGLCVDNVSHCKRFEWLQALTARSKCARSCWMI